MLLRYFIAFVLVAGAANCNADTPSASDSGSSCDDSGGQTGELGCVEEKHQVLDAQLNKLYSQVKSELQGEELNLLVQAQRAWLKYMKADCASRLASSEREPEDEGASYHLTLSIQNLYCENEHLKNRLEILKELNSSAPVARP
jgi:uncharacterized protein YecT (DUF1311 family)